MGQFMNKKNDVEVLINGRKYTMCGFESAEYLQQVATYINGKYADFKKKDYYYTLDIELRDVLLAINIADDYFKSQQENKAMLRDNERKDKMVFNMKHEILESKNTSDGVERENTDLQNRLEEAEKKIVELNVIHQEDTTKMQELEERLSKSEAEKSANLTKYETECEKTTKAEGENVKLKKKVDTLQDKVKKLEKASTEAETTYNEKYKAAKVDFDAKIKVEKEKYETAKKELMQKFETAKSELTKKQQTANDKLKEKYTKELEKAKAELNGEEFEKIQAENVELKAKFEAAEKRIADLEAKGRRGKRR